MAAGGGMVYWKNWIRLRDAKKHTIKAFWWFKGDLISQWIPKFYLCDESNPINPKCGKIYANFYISPPHPPHPQFYPQKWWKFRYTSWLTKKIASHRAGQKCGLRMRRECRERFPRHRLQRKPLVSDPGMNHGTCAMYVPWRMSGSLTRGGRVNVPGIPGACAIHNFAYLASGLYKRHMM